MSRCPVLMLLLSTLPVLSYGQCDELRKKFDKFENSTTIRTPSLKGTQFEPVNYVRVDKNGVTVLYLRLTASAMLSAPKREVLILFKDGTKLEWPDEKVEFDYHSGYFCNCFIELNQEQIEKLENNEITDFKLYVYDRALTQKQSLRAKEMIRCITSANPDAVKEERRF